jgi:DNA-directed RNA polymerase subunit RPC12/RpoP
MPISLSCDCGRKIRVKDEHAGRKVRCPACGIVLEVPVPEMEVEVEGDASDYSITETPKSKPPPLPKSKAPVDEQISDRKPLPRPSRAPIDEPIAKRSPMPRPRRTKSRRSRSESSGWSMPSIAISPTIITGILMMLGAVAWFILGLAVGWIYFYPPILFVLGMAAVVRGLMGHED